MSSRKLGFSQSTQLGGIVPGSKPTPNPLTAKGDLFTHDGTADAALAIGSTGQVLTVDPTAANGLAYKTPAPTGLATGYEVDLSAAGSGDLKIGGDGLKSIDGKAWYLQNVANAATVFLADGTHAGLYLKCSATSSDYRNALNNAPTLLAGLEDLTGIGARSCIEQWALVMFEQPHTPNAVYEGCRIGIRLVPPVADPTLIYNSADLGRAYGGLGPTTLGTLTRGSITFKFNYSDGTSDTWTLTGADIAALANAQGYGAAATCPSLVLKSLMPFPSTLKLISTIDTTIVGLGPYLSNGGSVRLHIDSNAEYSFYNTRTGINANGGPYSEPGQNQHVITAGTADIAITIISGGGIQTFGEFHRAGTQTSPSAAAVLPLTTDDVYAFRILNNVNVEIYAGQSVSGNFPALSALRFVARANWNAVASGFDPLSVSVAGSSAAQWALFAEAHSTNNAAASDLLLKKIRILQR